MNIENQVKSKIVERYGMLQKLIFVTRNEEVVGSNPISSLKDNQ